MDVARDVLGSVLPLVLAGLIGYVAKYFRDSSLNGRAKAHLDMADMYADAQMAEEQQESIEEARKLLLLPQVRKQRRLNVGRFRIGSQWDVLAAVAWAALLGSTATVVKVDLSIVAFFAWLLVAVLAGALAAFALDREDKEQKSDVDRKLKSLPVVTASGTDRPDRGDATTG